MESINPLLGIHAAVTRQSIKDEPEGGWYPKQKLTLEESIVGFTRIPAWVARKEKCLGTLAVGSTADLTIFEKDLFHIPPSEWPFVHVEMTIINGEMVYEKSV